MNIENMMIKCCEAQRVCAFLPPFLRTPEGKTNLNGTGEEGNFLI